MRHASQGGRAVRSWWIDKNVEARYRSPIGHLLSERACWFGWARPAELRRRHRLPHHILGILIQATYVIQSAKVDDPVTPRMHFLSLARAVFTGNGLGLRGLTGRLSKTLRYFLTTAFLEPRLCRLNTAMPDPSRPHEPKKKKPTLMLLHEGLGFGRQWGIPVAALRRATAARLFSLVATVGYGNSKSLSYQTAPRPAISCMSRRTDLPRLLTASALPAGPVVSATATALDSRVSTAPAACSIIACAWPPCWMAPHFFICEGT